MKKRIDVVEAPKEMRDRVSDLLVLPLEDIANRLMFKMEHVSRRQYAEHEDTLPELLDFSDMISTPLPRDIVVRAVLAISEEELAVVNYNLVLNIWKVDKRAIFDICMSNLLQERYSSIGINDVLSKFMPEIDEFGNMGMYVLSNDKNNLGARVLLRKDIFSLISTDIGKSFYILPSSIHELILLFNDDVDGDMLIDLVTHINNTEIDFGDKLSDSVMHYDAEDGFEIVRQGL